MNMNLIPIVLATDINYAMPTCVALNSILATKEVSTKYKFILLIPDHLDEVVKVKFDMLIKKYPGTTIEYMLMGSQFTQAPSPISHITHVMYYRLIIAELIPHYDKCIYLDGDVIVKDDLTDLYYYNIKNNYIAGVKALAFQTFFLTGNEQWYLDKTGLISLDQYINSGVLLMNLAAIRRDGLTQRFLDTISDRLMCPDQDILNMVCYNRISFLPLRYNYQPVRLADPNIYNAIVDVIYSAEEITNAKSNPAIIHYLDKVKPWNCLTGIDFARWWQAALNSPFTDEVWARAEAIQVERNSLIEQVGMLNDELTHTRSLNEKLVESEVLSEATKEQIRNELEMILRSTTWHVGRFVTFIPRKLKGGIKCIKDHGLSYTIKHSLYKMKTKPTR